MHVVAAQNLIYIMYVNKRMRIKFHHNDGLSTLLQSGERSRRVCQPSGSGYMPNVKLQQFWQLCVKIEHNPLGQRIVAKLCYVGGV